MMWLAEISAGEEVAFRVGREGSRLIAEWPGVATLSANRDGTGVVFVGDPRADAAHVEKLRSSAVPALLRHLEGKLTLHASAVAWRGRSIAFIGDSGRGKSTIAFALANEESFALLADDCLQIEGASARASDAEAWIDRDEHSKTPSRPKNVATNGGPIAAIFVLAFGAEVRITRLHGSAVGAALERAMIRFVLDEPAVHVTDLERLGNLAARVPVYELSRPRGEKYFQATREELERLLSTDNL